MEYVHGSSLEDLLQEKGRMGADEAALIGREVCRALAAVHRAGLLHRDIKTGNVMRAEGGRIVLMDFGAGTITEAEASARLVGTPFYLAPEVLAGAPATRFERMCTASACCCIGSSHWIILSPAPR